MWGKPATKAKVIRLSMIQAIKMALKQSPEIQKSLILIAGKQAERRIARSALEPSVKAVAMQRRDQVNIDTFLGTPSPGGPLVAGPYTWGAAGIMARYPIFDLTLWNRWKASRQVEISAKAKAKAVREGICALVVGQYLFIQRTQESIKAAESRVRLAESLLKLATDLQKNSVGTKLDSLRADVQLQNERQRLIHFRGELKKGLFGLMKLLVIPPGTKIEITDTLTIENKTQFNFDDACKIGLSKRPEILSLKAEKKAAEMTKKAIRSERNPSLVLTGAYNTSGLKDQPYIPTGNIQLAVEFPLLDGGRISAEIKKASTEVRRISEEQRSLKTQIQLEVQVAQTDIGTSLSEVELASQSVTLAEDELLQARHRFQAGVSNNIDVVNAQDELAKATDRKIGAIFHLNQARADLAKAVGQLEQLFLANGDSK